MKTILVTGGNGYIGSHMCKLLFKEGLTVFIIDNFSTSPQSPTHSYGKFIQGDIADCELVSKVIKDNRIDTVFHFAARATVIESEQNPLLYYQENVVKGLSFFKTAIEAGVKNIIFSSTCATFGKPQTDTIGELHPQNPINCYGNTKLILELALKDLARKKLLDSAIVLRYFNAAGSSPDGEIGENHTPEYHLIPNILNQTTTLQIHGNSFPTPDGSPIRDYIHVDDLASAHWLAMQFGLKHGGFHDFNLGSETGHSVFEVIKSAEEILNSKIHFKIVPARDGDPSKLISDSSKAKKLLRWIPKYSLKDCISHTLKYKGRG